MAGAASAGASGAGAANATAGSGSGDSESATVAGVLAAHNRARAAVTPAADPAIPALSWSGTVAATAQAYAEQCKFEHSQGSYGENLYAAAGKDASPQDVVDSWMSEAEHYDYAANSCSGTCGHYTQVVWRKSARLGCGVAKCSKNSPFSGFADWQLWVCNYDPPGNVNNARPY
jgi:pathogenesis-related protein 1